MCLFQGEGSWWNPDCCGSASLGCPPRQNSVPLPQEGAAVVGEACTCLLWLLVHLYSVLARSGAFAGSVDSFGSMFLCQPALCSPQTLSLSQLYGPCLGLWVILELGSELLSFPFISSAICTSGASHFLSWSLPACPQCQGDVLSIPTALPTFSSPCVYGVSDLFEELLALPVSSKNRCFCLEDHYISAGGTAEHPLSCWGKELCCVERGAGRDGVSWGKQWERCCPAHSVMDSSAWVTQPACGWDGYRNHGKMLPKSVDCQHKVFFLVVCWGIGFYSGLFFPPPFVTLVSSLVSHRTEQWEDT